MYVADSQYISQFAQDLLGFEVYQNGALIDPDNNLVHLRFINDDTQVTIFERDVPRISAGVYGTHMSSAESTQPGSYRLHWSYQLGGVPDEYEGFATIGRASPAYDALVPGMKEIVDQVWVRFADLFDSPDGGPNLQTYFETKFGRGRIAQLLRLAVGRLNTVAQPFQTYTIDGDGGASFPIAQWGALLERATFVETVKHLIRSYVEQPAFVGGNVTRLDRRDYMDRWRSILDDEQEDLKDQLDTFKIRNMNLGRPAVLVAGGVYGRYQPTRYAGTAAARGRFYSRGLL